jgi:predicted Fe-Mo cluster-binding NifX family protein
MKICVPSSGKGGLDDLVGQHFGRVPTYTVKDTETNEIRTIENKSEHMGGVGLPPELLSQAGVEVMLCGGLGNKAVQQFEQFGIEVYVGAKGTVEETIMAWEAGKLPKATSENACQSHEHHHHH